LPRHPAHPSPHIDDLQTRPRINFGETMIEPAIFEGPDLAQVRFLWDRLGQEPRLLSRTMETVLRVEALSGPDSKLASIRKF